MSHPWIDIFPLDIIPKKISMIWYYGLRFLIHISKGRENKELLYKYTTRYKNRIGGGNVLFSYTSEYLKYPQKILYPDEFFSKKDTLLFEGKKYIVPNNKEILLTNIYGDYLTPPPSEKRIAKHSVELIE